MTKILIATKNDGKAREYRKLFEPKGIEVITLKDLNEQVEIIEDGKTFSENALIKAQTLTDKLNIPVLGDDSGLVVDALNGAPGIYSARYAGDHDDEANNKKLLEELKKVPDEKRTAHFHCSIVATAPDKTPLEANGDVYGLIAHEKHGSLDSSFHAASSNTLAIKSLFQFFVAILLVIKRFNIYSAAK